MKADVHQIGLKMGGATVLLWLAVSIATAGPGTAPGDDEAAYSAAIEKRVDEIMAALKLPDSPAADRVRGELVARYRALRDWHAANDARLKELGWRADIGRPASGARSQPDAETLIGRSSVDESRFGPLNSVSREKPADDSIRRARIDVIELDRLGRHNHFVNALAADLTPEQVAVVKDKMTYDKFRVTYNAYLEIVPDLTDGQKAKLRAILYEAREEAMDGGSSEEKSATFKRYKNQCKAYLISQGHDVNQDYKDWGEAQKKKAASRPTEK